MADEGTKVTLRMGPEEIQMMEDYMAEHDVGTRSDFIRDAIKCYVSIKNMDGNTASGSGIFVRFSDFQLDVLHNLVESGLQIDEEAYVRKCVLDKIIPESYEDDVIANAVRTAQRNAALK